MSPDPLDQDQQRAVRELDQSRRIRDHGCGCDGITHCKDIEAIR